MMSVREEDVEGGGGAAVQMFGGPEWDPGGGPLHLADDVSGHGRVEVDGVMPETLRRLVALPAAALEGFAHLDLGPVAVLGVILDPVHILQPLEGDKDARQRL